MRHQKLWILLLLLGALIPQARADVGLMIEQPYGKFGNLSPTGHAAIYLSRICAETPTRLRRCRPDENGVVISRYSSVGHYDWVAIPLIPYLYAVENLQQVPSSIDRETLVQLRDRYRRRHLENLAPDKPNQKMPGGLWTELIGSAYIRQIFVYELETTPSQDDRLIRALNAKPNDKKFNFFFRNCANFAESVLNFYYPHAVHRSFTADLGLATPKQIAKSFEAYSRVHSDLQFSVFEIPQVPGEIERSGKICGVAEALIKKKQYVVPLAILHPYFAVALIGTYFTRGRFNPGKDAVVLDPSSAARALLTDEAPASGPQPARTEKTPTDTAHLSIEGCVQGSHCSNQISDQANPTLNEQQQVDPVAYQEPVEQHPLKQLP